MIITNSLKQDSSTVRRAASAPPTAPYYLPSLYFFPGGQIAAIHAEISRAILVRDKKPERLCPG